VTRVTLKVASDNARAVEVRCRHVDGRSLARERRTRPRRSGRQGAYAVRSWHDPPTYRMMLLPCGRERHRGVDPMRPSLVRGTRRRRQRRLAVMGGFVIPGAPRTDVEPCRHRNGRCAAPAQGLRGQGNDTVPHSNVDALTGSLGSGTRPATKVEPLCIACTSTPDEQCGGSTFVVGAATAKTLTG
jgi:hypothetical protein